MARHSYNILIFVSVGIFIFGLLSCVGGAPVFGSVGVSQLTDQQGSTITSFDRVHYPLSARIFAVYSKASRSTTYFNDLIGSVFTYPVSFLDPIGDVSIFQSAQACILSYGNGMLYLQQQISGSGTADATTLSSVPKSNVFLDYFQDSTSFATVLTYFPDVSTNMSLLITPLLSNPATYVLSFASPNVQLVTPVSSSSEVDFMVKSSNLIALASGGTVYVFEMINKVLNLRSQLSNTASNTAIVSDKLYTCTIGSDGLYLETVDINNGKHASYHLLSNVTRCMSICLYSPNNQLFMSVVDINGNLAVVSTTIGGGSPTMLTITPNEAVDTSKIRADYYTIGADSKTSVYIFSPNGNVYNVSFTNLCPNQCSQHGDCSYDVCTCYQDWTGADCSVPRPNITSATNAAFVGTTVVDINGAHFFFTSNYSIKYCGLSCTNMVYYADSHIACTLNTTGNQQYGPFDQCPLTVQLDGYKSLDFMASYAAPNLYTNYTQQLNVITVYGTKLLPSQYLKCLFTAGTIQVQCTVTSNTVSLSVPSGTHNTDLRITSVNGDYYFNQQIRLTPYLIGLDGVNIDTNANIVVEVIGDFFQSDDQATLQVYFGNTLLTGTVEDATHFTLNAPQGIVSNKTITVLYNNAFSNTLAFKYNPPTVTSTTFDLVDTNVITIAGTNFGSSSSLVHLIDSNGEIVSLTFISVSDSSIVASLPSIILTDDYLLQVDLQNATNNKVSLSLQPAIKSVTKPSVEGGDITIVGEYLIDNDIVLINPYDGYSQSNLDDCESVGNDNYPATIVCQMPPGAGLFRIYAHLLIKDLESDEFSTSYQAPSITDIKPKQYFENETTTFTIFGDNFNQLDITIQINNESCTVNQTNTHNVTCELTSALKATTSNPVPVILTVAGQSTSSNNTLSFYQKRCMSDCSSHGQCDYKVAVCKCDTGYIGQDCSQVDPNADPLSLSTKFSDNISFGIITMTLIALSLV